LIILIVDNYNKEMSSADNKQCQGCNQKYESNINPVLCKICSSLKQEIFLKTVMASTWEKFKVHITYRIHYTDHNALCKNYDQLEKEKDIESTLEFELLKKFKSTNIDSNGNFIVDDYTRKHCIKYCKDPDTICKCGQKRLYTIVSASIYRYSRYDRFLLLE